MLVVSTALYFVGCVDLTVTDISDKRMELVSPGDQVIIDTTYVVFSWEELIEDVQYQLRIFKGNSFDDPDYLVLDSITDQTSISCDLTSEEYVWGVRAINEYFETQFESRNIVVVDDSLDLDQIRLLFPEDNQVLEDTVIQFNWDTELVFDEYIFTVEELPDLGAVTTEAFILRAFPNEEATYNWSVKGVLSGESYFVESDVFSFDIDPDE